MDIKKPLADLIDARRCLDEMRHAASFADFERAWGRFLDDLSRAWHKTNACVKPVPAVKAHPTMENAKRLIGDGGDELLVYLRMARNVREHGLEEITAQQPGGIGIGPPPGSNSLILENFHVRNGKVTFQAPQGARVAFIPGRVVPMPFEVAGKVYPLPAKHLGSALDNTDAIAMGQCAVAFYEKVINDIGALLSQQAP